MTNWQTELTTLDSKPRLLLLLSGGKDSVCCLYKLANWGEYSRFECVTFIHKWCSKVSLEEARHHCSHLGIRLREIDFTQELERALSGFSNGRPCLKCKPEMYKRAIILAQRENFNWIVTGDNGNDRTTFNRLVKYNLEHNNLSYHFCSRYLAGEQGLELPPNIWVLRPLMCSSSDEIENELKKNKITVNRNYSTGDKYFEYSREGCALQFCDPGVELTQSIRDDLLEYNIVANDYGRQHKIRTSVHIPSTFIVTIPEGNENNVADALIQHGLKVNFSINSTKMSDDYITIIVENAMKSMTWETFIFLFNRFVERLELPKENILLSDKRISYKSPSLSFYAIPFWDNAFVINMRGPDTQLLDDKRLSQLLTELFHTRKIRINRTH